jgi:hypothetical protein
MSLDVDPCEILVVQRTLRHRLLGAAMRRHRSARELAARMLLYVDDAQGAWRELLAHLHADCGNNRACCEDRP